MKSNLPKISVITVVYNGATHLEQAILSVFDQDYPNTEYIIIDGGSTDGSLKIIEKYKEKISYFISEKDKGIYDAMNKGIVKSTGDLICFKNADDWFLPKAFWAAAEAWQINPKAILYGHTHKVWSGREEKYSIIKSNPQGLKQRTTIDHRSVFIPGEWHRNNLYDLRFKWVADYHLLLKAVKQKIMFVSLEKPIAAMRTGGASDQPKVYEELFKAQKEVFGAPTAYANWVFNRSLFYLFKVKNEILKAILGPEKFQTFKTRKQ